MKTTFAVPLLLLSVACLAAPLPSAGAGEPVDVSRWRGFNLLEKFTLSKDSRFAEDDFRWIRELGFNFVRLPMDYRCYAPTNDPLAFKEDVLKEVDEAVEFGRRHGIHVCINLHRAPGFCINPPAEPTCLWTNAATLETFAAHWQMFARRYKGVPSSRLSFNLLNEPARTTREDYLRVFRRAIEAIQAVDPDRLIVVDGLNVGREPLPEFLAYSNVVQATRGYHPGTISHYRAGWAKGSDTWPEPTWPIVRIAGYLYGPVKKEFAADLVLEGPLPAGAEVSLRLDRISGRMDLLADAVGAVVARRAIDPAAETNDWLRSPKDPKYRIYEARGDVRFTIPLAAGTPRLAIRAAAGDWITFSELAIRMPDGTRRAAGTDIAWGRRQTSWRLAPDGRILPPPGVPEDAMLAEYLQPWRDIAAKGEQVFVGEWGCYNKTPHPVALAWMKAWLEQWKSANLGWALWNFRGSFGVLDSDRADVAYEDWNGHKLDRKMLTLLQQYAK